MSVFCLYICLKFELEVGVPTLIWLNHRLVEVGVPTFWKPK